MELKRFFPFGRHLFSECILTGSNRFDWGSKSSGDQDFQVIRSLNPTKMPTLNFQSSRHLPVWPSESTPSHNPLESACYPVFLYNYRLGESCPGLDF